MSLVVDELLDLLGDGLLKALCEVGSVGDDVMEKEGMEHVMALLDEEVQVRPSVGGAVADASEVRASFEAGTEKTELRGAAKVEVEDERRAP